MTPPPIGPGRIVGLPARPARLTIWCAQALLTDASRRSGTSRVGHVVTVACTAVGLVALLAPARQARASPAHVRAIQVSGGVQASSREQARIGLSRVTLTGDGASPSGRTLDFVPSDPLASKQWYLGADHAFDPWAALPQPPTLPGVRVAVIDSGIDGTHPELQGRIATGPNGAPLARSFVDNNPLTDQQGHGTFVAGEIAASLNNGAGIAGIAFPAQLVIAKVVRPDGSIPVGAEAAAIRWAADAGARVINLSLGGVRDPFNATLDTYSRIEADAVAYATSKGAVVVAAVGNGDQAPRQPWRFASYPAALPHVIGVSAYAPDGSVPDFSNRDPLYNDIAAPGVNLLSTFPIPLTALSPGCADQGYSDCANSIDYTDAEGTSFAAPQVSAAAALLLSLHPELTSDQAAWILERSADDMTPQTGCTPCTPGRDALTGWGKLDIARALELANGPLPIADRYEPNNDANQAASLIGKSTRLQATIDYWDNPIDVYRTHLHAGQWLAASLRGQSDLNLSLALWSPATQTIITTPQHAPNQRILQTTQHGPDQQLLYQAPTPGWYYLEIEADTPTAGNGDYTLRVSKS